MDIETIAKLGGIMLAGSLVVGYVFASFYQIIAYVGEPQKVRKELEKRGIENLPPSPSSLKQTSTILHLGPQVSPLSYPGSYLEKRYRNMCKTLQK